MNPFFQKKQMATEGVVEQNRQHLTVERYPVLKKSYAASLQGAARRKPCTF